VANTNTNVLPKLLAQGVLALRQNAVMPQLVNRSYESMASQKGSVINVPIPSAVAARDVTPSITMNSNVDSAPTVAVVTLDFWKEAPFQLSDSDFLQVDPMFMPMQASEALKSLANAVDSYVLGKHLGIFGIAGTPGTTPFNASLNIAARADMLLNRQLAPMQDRRAVINPLARENLILNTAVLQADARGDQGGIISGSIGTKLGFDWYMDQNISSYTPGTGWASGNIASTVGGAVGDSTLNIINATASGQIKIGDVFTLTADTANSHQYVVTATTTISATVQVAIAFYPPLKTTVATGATLVVVSVAYTVNLAFHRDAFAWASRPLNSANSVGNLFQAPVDPVSGLALRLELSRQYKQDTYSFDILGGGNLVRPELAVKIAGA
jgi:hypothetical protein